MNYNFKWEMDENKFSRLITAIKTANNRLGCYGNVYIGNYCIDITLDDDYVNLDFYHIGIDSGYGYTVKKGTPYDFEDNKCLATEKGNVLGISLADFKKKAEEMIADEFSKQDENFLEKEVLCQTADWS